MTMMLHPAEVARRLGVSQRTLRRYRADGQGPPWVALNPRVIRYPEDKFAEYIKQLQVAAR